VSFTVAPAFVIRLALLPHEFVERVQRDPSAAVQDALENRAFLAALSYANPLLLGNHLTKKSGRTNTSLSRYVKRAASRTTPMGLFASVGLGSFVDQKEAPEISINSIVGSIFCRPPANEKARDLAIRIARGDYEGLLIRRSGSVLSLGNRLYTMAGTVDELTTTASIRRTAMLDRILEACDRPKHSVGSLILLISREESRPVAESRTLVCALIKSGFLELVDSDKRCAASVRIGLSDVSDTTRIDTIAALDKATLPNSVAEKARRVATALLQVGPYPDGIPAIIAFRRKFLERYGEAHLVPLLHLLHPAFGLGSPYATKISVKHPKDDHLVRIAGDALALGVAQIDLAENGQLESLSTWDPSVGEFPNSVDLALLLSSTEVSTLLTGRYEMAISPVVGAREAGRLLGRFASLVGIEGSNAFAFAVDIEARLDPSVLHCDLVFEPNSKRAKDVAMVARVRNYAIVDGAALSDTDITLDDIAIGVDRGRFFAWSKNRDRRIRGHCMHAVNPEKSPLAFRFLQDIANDGSPALSAFEWGTAVNFPVLPRITYEGITIASRRWSKTELERCLREFGTNGVQIWQHKYKVPDKIVLRCLDRTMPLHLAHEDDRHYLARKVHIRGSFLEEPLLRTQPAGALDRNGEVHAVEIVVSMFSPPRLIRRAEGGDLRMADFLEQPRYAPLLSEWTYLKAYVEPPFDIPLLIKQIVPKIAELRKLGFIDSWFFVRYADPEHHLRVRTRSRSVELASVSAMKLSDALSRVPECRKIEFATYEPEVIRYGGPQTIDIAESVFHLDSDNVVSLLSHSDVIDEHQELRAAVSVSHYLEPFDLKVYELRGSAASVGAGVIARKLRKSFTDAQQSSTTYLETVGIALDSLHSLDLTLQRYQSRLQAMGQPVRKIFASLAHMHLNRLIAPDRSREERILALAARLIRSRRLCQRDNIH